jgi:hypothetical protein
MLPAIISVNRNAAIETGSSIARTSFAPVFGVARIADKDWDRALALNAARTRSSSEIAPRDDTRSHFTGRMWPWAREASGRRGPPGEHPRAMSTIARNRPTKAATAPPTRQKDYSIRSIR